MNKYHDIKNLDFTENAMKIVIDGKNYNFILEEISPILVEASNSERRNYKISPSGYGIYWPSIDEDLSIDGLLGIIHKVPRRRKTLTIK